MDTNKEKKVNYRLAWKISKRVENIVFFTFLVLALLFLFVLYPMAKQDMIVGIIGICCAFFCVFMAIAEISVTLYVTSQSMNETGE